MLSVIGSLGAPLVATIALDDHVSVDTAQWMLTAALLVGALSTPIMGRLADGPQQRRVLLTSLWAVLAGSLLAAASPNFWILVAGRALQGVGLGLLPVTMAVARRHLSFERASKAIAMLSVTAAIGVGLGYPVTSALAEVASYRVSFLFGAAMVLIALVVVARFVPGGTGGTSMPFDLIGALLLSVALISGLVVLAEGGAWGWTSPGALVLLGCSGLSAVTWVVVELRRSHPLVDLRQVRHRSVLMADVAGLLISIAMYLLLPVTVLLVQLPASSGGFNASPFVAGLMLVPLSAGTFAASRVVPAVADRIGDRAMIPLGALLFAVAAVGFALEHQSLAEAFVALAVVGIGAGVTFAALPGFIVRSVPAAQTGSATGFYQVLRSIGLSFGSALATALLSAYTPVGDLIPKVQGFEVALWVAAVLCVTTAVVSWVLPGRLPPRSTSASEAAARHEVEEEGAELGATAFGLGPEVLDGGGGGG